MGPVALIPLDGVGTQMPGASETSEATQRKVDEEVGKIIESAAREVRDLLVAHRQNLDALVQALLEHETLDEVDAYASAGLTRGPVAVEDASPVGAA